MIDKTLRTFVSSSILRSPFGTEKLYFDCGGEEKVR